ncbi:MAG: Inositol 2-dehydrogenase/D-chiro-inositol 3-dehydrogenase [Planctomycetota bacterium]
MRLRVGIVGLGDQWESRHLPALRALADRFEVRGICEQVAHRAQRAAAQLGAVAVDGFRALAARDDIDAILLLADQWYGVTPILAACDHGKAVYSAASLPVDAEAAGTLRRRVEAAGIAFMAELPRRHAPATLRLKELIATRLGPPRMLFCHRRAPQAATPIGDATAENRDLVELVDWCRYVAGAEPTSVIAVRHADPPGSATADYRMMSLDFSASGHPGDGVLAQISCGYYMPQRWEEAVGFRPPAALQAACEQGIAFIDLPASLVWFDTAGRHQESLDSERPVGEQMLVQFHRRVTSLVRSMSGLDDALRAIQIVQAGETSQAEGRRVMLSQ